jgi:HSP20 family molecular chaperone IbpA
MPVAQWDSQRFLDNSQARPTSQDDGVSDPVPSTKLWIGHQGEPGISRVHIHATGSEIFIELELIDIDCNHLMIQASPDLLILSGILYRVTDAPLNEQDLTPSEPSYQPQSFRDLIPLPCPVLPESAIATLSEQCLRVTLPLRTDPKSSVNPYYSLNTLCMSDLLVPSHW